MKTKLIGSIATLLAGVVITVPRALGHGKDVHDYYPKPKAYPFLQCLVTDEKLGEHGKPYVFKHKGQEIKLSCKSCLKIFKEDPAKYLKKLKDSVTPTN